MGRRTLHVERRTGCDVSGLRTPLNAQRATSNASSSRLPRRRRGRRQRAPLGVEQWFASHPLEEERIAATRAHVARLDPAALEGLVEDDAAFQAFKARLAALPPPPQPPQQPR